MKTPEKIIFRQTSDFYWKSLAVYSVIFIFFSVFVGTIENGEIKIIIRNPIVILLGFITLITLLALIYRWWRARAIILTQSHIIFKSRFSRKEYPISAIKMISFTRERIFRTKREFRIIKIVIEGRKHNIRVRPSSFDEEVKIVKTFRELKARLRNA